MLRKPTDFTMSMPDSVGELSDSSLDLSEVSAEEIKEDDQHDEKEDCRFQKYQLNIEVKFSANPAAAITFKEDSKRKRMIVTDTPEELELLKGFPILTINKQNVIGLDSLLLEEMWLTLTPPVVVKFGTAPIELDEPNIDDASSAANSSFQTFEDHIMFLGETTTVAYDDDTKIGSGHMDVVLEEESKEIEALSDDDLNELFVDLQPISFEGTQGDQSSWTQKCKERAKIIAELLNTEKSYISGLWELTNKFIKPYVKPLKKSTGVDISSFQKKVQNLIKLHNDIYDNFRNAENICAVFQKDFKFLRMYMPYIRDYEETYRKLREGSEKRSFEWVFKKGGRKISSDPLGYFQARGITIVQRTPRYMLLLHELKKKTPSRHPMYNDLEKSLTEIRAICDDINEYQWQLEKELRFIELAKDIDPRTLRDHGIEQLVIPARRLIREGKVAIIRTKSNRMYIKRREVSYELAIVVMCNDILLIMRGKKNRVIKLFVLSEMEAEVNNIPIKPSDNSQKIQELFQVVFRKRTADEIKKMRDWQQYQKVSIKKNGKTTGGSMVKLLLSNLESSDGDENFSIYSSTLKEANEWEESIRKYASYEESIM